MIDEQAMTSATGRPCSTAPVIERCPRCRSRGLTAVPTREGVVFRCERCTSRWRYELGYVRAAK